MRELTAEPVDAGGVRTLRPGAATTQGRATAPTMSPSLSNGRPSLPPNLGVVRAMPPKALPIELTKMERHPSVVASVHAAGLRSLFGRGSGAARARTDRRISRR